MCCHIQISPDQRLFASFPEHFGGYTVFLRLCMPSHPPYTLSSLTTLTKDRPPGGREAPEIEMPRLVQRWAFIPSVWCYESN